jgi:hypothetical protein
MWNSRRRSSGLVRPLGEASLLWSSLLFSKGMLYVMGIARPMSAESASELNSVWLWYCCLLTTRGRLGSALFEILVLHKQSDQFYPLLIGSQEKHVASIAIISDRPRPPSLCATRHLRNREATDHKHELQSSQPHTTSRHVKRLSECCSTFSRLEALHKRGIRYVISATNPCGAGTRRSYLIFRPPVGYSFCHTTRFLHIKSLAFTLCPFSVSQTHQRFSSQP